MPFENILNLKVKAFFFNAATDYLPYYKNFALNMDKGSTFLDVLNRIKRQNPDFSFPNKNIILKVNGKIIKAETLVSDIVDEMGEEFQIDPVSSYRSINGLIINDDDFMKSFELLAPYASEEDKAFYEKLYDVHYASESSNYNREYIGDAILLLANRMVDNDSKDKKAILEAISDEFNGIRCCEYENNIFKGKDYAETIETLKNMITIKDTATKCDKISFRKRDHQDLNIESLEGIEVALYVGNSNATERIKATEKKIQSAGAKLVSFDMSTKLAGQSLMDTNFQMAHEKAGKMMLNALDSGADILVCIDPTDVTIFQNAHVHCERVVGRDIELKIISVERLENIATATV